MAAAQVHHCAVPTLAVRGEDRTRYYRHIGAALDHRPQRTMDDAAALISELPKHSTTLLLQVIGGAEATTTGVIRLHAMAAAKALKFPVFAVNDAMTKHLCDNHYGTGKALETASFLRPISCPPAKCSPSSATATAGAGEGSRCSLQLRPYFAGISLRKIE